MKGTRFIKGTRTPITYRVKWKYTFLLGDFLVKVQAPVKRRFFGLGYKTVDYRVYGFVSQMPERIKEVCVRAVEGYEHHKLAWETEHYKEQWEKDDG